MFRLSNTSVFLVKAIQKYKVRVSCFLSTLTGVKQSYKIHFKRGNQTSFSCKGNLERAKCNVATRRVSSSVNGAALTFT